MGYTHWQTKDGKHIKIKDMSTEHIKNCLNGLNRKTDTFKFKNCSTVEDYELQSEIVLGYIDSFNDELESRDFWDYVNNESIVKGI